MISVRIVLFCIAIVLAAKPADAAGFQWSSTRDAGDRTIELAIWYPSHAQTAETRLGPYHETVAMNGAVAGTSHPLIVISHGTGGSLLTHHETALALAGAGYVVAALAHPGDNYKDRSDSFTPRNFNNRADHVRRTIDFITQVWADHGAIDTARIGVLGHSAGGTTALIVAGGTADMSKLGAFCDAQPADWGCRNARKQGASRPAPDAATIAGTDPRVKAIVVMAPALAPAFDARSLGGIKIPVQLWIAEEDMIVRDGMAIGAVLPVPPERHVVAHAGHFAFLAPCGTILSLSAPEICDDPRGFDRARFLGDFQRDVIAFFGANLK